MYGRENNERVGCIKFWEQGRNPITMKRCVEENVLHRHNQSKEQEISLKRYRETRVTLDFNFKDQ